MPSRRTVLGGCAGLLSTLAGCSLLPPPPGEEPHSTRNWLYDPTQFADEWDHYRITVGTPVLWDEHRRWLGGDAVDQALAAHRPYYERFGVETREVDWVLDIGDGGEMASADSQNATGAGDRTDALPGLRVSAAAFDRQRVERRVNDTAEERDDDYETMAMFHAPARNAAYAVGGDYLADCHHPDADASEALRTCIDTQTGSMDRFPATSADCRRLADALAEDADYCFDLWTGPDDGTVGRGWRRLFDGDTTYLRGVVLFADEDRADESTVEDHVALPEWRSDRDHSVRVEGPLGVLTAERPTETVRLDGDPVVFA